MSNLIAFFFIVVLLLSVLADKSEVEIMRPVIRSLFSSKWCAIIVYIFSCTLYAGLGYLVAG